MAKLKYKYIIVREETITKITELTAPISLKDTQELLSWIKQTAKSRGHNLKLQRVSADYRGRKGTYIKR